MDHLCSDKRRTQDDTCPEPEAEGPKREREDDSQGPGASVSWLTSVVGAGATAEQDSHIQRMQDQLNMIMEAIRGKAPSTVEALV